MELIKMKKFVICMTLCVLLLCSIMPMALADDGKICDVCKKSVDSVELLPCGDHSACAVCAARTEFIPLDRHTIQQPCGQYDCSGHHNRIPNLACPDTENPHYACESEGATHECPACGKEYICESQANYHAYCRVCKGYFCDGGFHCGYDRIVGDYVCYYPDEEGRLSVWLFGEAGQYRYVRYGYEYTTDYAR